MSPRVLVPRELALRDVDEAVAWYVAEADPDTALRFIDALERAYTHISDHPAAGSPRMAHELNLAGLRFWPLAGFPFLVFYVEQSSHVDVWRVLHAHRDVAVWLQESDEHA